MKKTNIGKKVLALSLAMVVTAGGVACGKNDVPKEPLEVTAGTPNYEDDKYIELAAYCGPRRGGYRYWNGYYGEYEGDPAGGWDGWITKEQKKRISDSRCIQLWLMACKKSVSINGESMSQFQMKKTQLVQMLTYIMQ